jgi:hypothetical protein
MSEIVTPDDLAVYLGVGLSGTDEDRAQLLIDDAIAQALSIVTVGTVPTTGATEANLPVGASSVIRAAVARVFQNPSGVSQEVLGSYSVSRAANSGAMFSSAERAALRRMAGRGSAFSIDLLQTGYPDTAFDA